MICKVINEGSTPRHALEGSQTHVESGRPQWSGRSIAQRVYRPPSVVRSGVGEGRCIAFEWRTPVSESGASQRICARRCSAAHACQTLLVALPIALFFHRALVVLLFALGDADLQFGAAFLPIELERYERIAFAIGRDAEVLDFLSIQQQLARADRVGHDVRGCRVEWRE